MNKKPFARRYANNWIIKIDNLFELRRLSRYNYSWGWAEDMKNARRMIDEREGEIEKNAKKP